MNLLTDKILSLDVVYNKVRNCNSPEFQQLYIKRRIQLLKNNSKNKTENYLETRKKILDLKYKSYCSLQFGSSENIFNVHPKSINCLKFSPNGNNLLCASKDGRISMMCLTNISYANPIIQFFVGHNCNVCDVDWNSTGDIFASVSEIGTIIIWSKNLRKPLRIINSKIKRKVNVCLFYKLNSNFLFIGDDYGLIRLCNISTGKVNEGIKSNGSIRCMVFDATGSYFWIGDNHGNVCTLKVMMVDSCRIRKHKRTLVSPQYTINNLDIHDSQKLTKNRRIYLLANCSDNFIYILRIDTNFAVQPFQRIRHNQENLDIRGHFISNYNLLKTSKYSICFFCGTSDGFVNFYYINDNAISQFDTLILTNKEPVIDSHFPKNLDYFICGTINGNIIIAETNNL